MSRQTVSRERVSEYGEVTTQQSEVDAMLDLVAQEAQRIESRFLEPACGTGNFLAEILSRKLAVVESRYGRDRLNFERYGILAVSSLYGIDLLQDNVETCRQRLFGIFDTLYTERFKGKTQDSARTAVLFILNRNIIRGNALELCTPGTNPKPIVFSEWSLVRGSNFKRRDYSFRELLDHQAIRDTPLFSDLGEQAFIPQPVKDYPITHFAELANVD